MSDDVYVIGIDMIKFGRYPDRTVPNLASEAALMALDDCGMSIDQMQALLVHDQQIRNALNHDVLI